VNNTVEKSIEEGVLSMDRQAEKASEKLAGRIYDASDYHKDDLLSSGLATTHEQFSDTYVEGEIGDVIDNINGKDIPIPRKSYNTEDD
jgi:hypothetical protein